MALTHFEIIRLPDSRFIKSFKGSDPLSAHVKYPISQQSQLRFERVNALSRFSVTGDFKWRCYNDTESIIGNTAVGNIKWVNDDEMPYSFDEVFYLPRMESEPFLILIPISNSTEFIEILSITSPIFTPNSDVNVGDIITVQDLLYTFVRIPENANGDPISIITYKVGNDFAVNPTEYTLTIKLPSLATLTLDNPSNPHEVHIRPANYQHDDGLIGFMSTEMVFRMHIHNGVPLGSAEVKLRFQGFGFLSNHPKNRIKIDWSGDWDAFDILTDTDEYYLNPTPILDSNGSLELVVTVRAVKDSPYVATGNIEIELESINESPNTISNTDYLIAVSLLDLGFD